MAPHFAAQGVSLNTTEYVVAKKSASGLVSALGTLMAIFTRLMEKARNAGLTDEDFHLLSKPEGEPLIDRIVQMMVEASNPKTMLTDTFKVTVDYGLTLKGMVEAGKYRSSFDYAHINDSHFPYGATVSGEIEIYLVHLGREATTDEVRSELDKMGLRPVNLPELLALGATHPSLQRKFRIAALGSECRQEKYSEFLMLDEDGGRRCDPYIIDFGYAWHANFRFAAVRK